MPRKPTTQTTPIAAIKHIGKRANIPTEELRGYACDAPHYAAID